MSEKESQPERIIAIIKMGPGARFFNGFPDDGGYPATVPENVRLELSLSKKPNQKRGFEKCRIERISQISENGKWLWNRNDLSVICDNGEEWSLSSGDKVNIPSDKAIEKIESMKKEEELREEVSLGEIRMIREEREKKENSESSKKEKDEQPTLSDKVFKKIS